MVNGRSSVQGPSRANDRFRSHDATPPAGGQISGVTRSAARSLLHVLVRDCRPHRRCAAVPQPRPAARAPGSKPTGRDNRRLSRRLDRRSAPARPRREHRPALVARPRPRPCSESAPGWFGWTGKVSATSSEAYCGASRSMVIGSRWLRLMSRWCRASGPPRHRRAYLGFGRSTGGGRSQPRTRLRNGPESPTDGLRRAGMMAWRAGNFAVRSREFGCAEQGILGVGAGNF